MLNTTPDIFLLSLSYLITLSFPVATLFITVFLIGGYISLASTSGDLAIIIISLILFFIKPDFSNSSFLNGFLPIISLENLLIYVVFTMIIIYKHRGNYKRLLNGTESRFLHKNK